MNQRLQFATAFVAKCNAFVVNHDGDGEKILQPESESPSINWQTEKLTISSSEDLSSLEQNSRAKTSSQSSIRTHVDGQLSLIKNQIGSLESVRERLGLSQRKMAQLLLVDPSAWTRWVKQGEDAPPHIYRALQWYLALSEKIPGLTPQYFIGKDPVHLAQENRNQFNQALEDQKIILESELVFLKKQNEDLKNGIRGNRAGFMLMAIAALIFCFVFYVQFIRVV
jgi:transcriptional regulator with XRE-family HTH domain